ncbi:MAG: division plane positioning ATPase MipZ [Bilophila wadsworthia]
MAHVHFFLNPKGGTGKSLVSYIVAQYLISKGVKTTCIDCDPVTPTLIAYEALRRAGQHYGGKQHRQNQI